MISVFPSFRLLDGRLLGSWASNGSPCFGRITGSSDYGNHYPENQNYRGPDLERPDLEDSDPEALSNNSAELVVLLKIILLLVTRLPSIMCNSGFVNTDPGSDSAFAV